MLLQFEKVSRTFPEQRAALDHVSFSLHINEFLTIVGPSGCGKSTLLKLASGLDQPTSGRITRDGALGASGSIAFVFQDATLMPWASVFDNIWLPLRLAGVSRAQSVARIHSLLDVVGLADVAMLRPAQLSGGMRMRVSIARAMVTRPRLLLMDEPFGSLDDFTRKRLGQDLLRWWRQEKMSVMLVTHQLSEAVLLGQRVIAMGARPGRIIEVIKVPEPASRDQEFMSSPFFLQTVNRLGDVIEADSRQGSVR